MFCLQNNGASFGKKSALSELTLANQNGAKFKYFLLTSEQFSNTDERVQEKKAGRKRLKDSKKRWRRKIEGDKYVSEPDSDNEQSEIPTVTMKNNSDPHQVQDEDLTVMLPMANHRRKKYADLKSIYEKREEMRSNEPFIRSLRQPGSTVVKPAEKFEF